MEHFEEAIDYSNYDQASLKECLSSIDRENNPKNYRALIAEIETRKLTGRWDQTSSDFQNILSDQRGIWILLCVIYLPAWFGIQFGYSYFIGREMPNTLQVAFFIVYFSGVILARWKMGQKRCPKCKEPFGALELNSVITYGRCPRCGYDGPKQIVR